MVEHRLRCVSAHEADKPDEGSGAPHGLRRRRDEQGGGRTRLEGGGVAGLAKGKDGKR